MARPVVSRDDARVLARFGPRRWMLAVMCVGLVLFALTAAVALVTLQPDEPGAGAVFRRLLLWAVIVLCPVYAVDTALRFLRRTPSVVATAAGLAFRSILGFTPVIPWAEIAAIAPVVIGRKLWLAIYLADPVRSVSRLGTGQRLMHVRSHAAGEPNIAFRAVHLGVSPAEAARVLEGIGVTATDYAGQSGKVSL